MIVLGWKILISYQYDFLAASLTSVHPRPLSVGTRLVELVERLMIGLREVLRVLVKRH